jgi:hypothetical protein
LVSGLLGGAYNTVRMTYDLRPLRLKGLIVRIPHTNSYALTTDGLKVGVLHPAP